MCHLVRPRWSLGVRLSAVLLVLVWAALVVPGARAAIPPEQDPFYTYNGAKPLANVEPGTVLKTRALTYHVAGSRHRSAPCSCSTARPASSASRPST